MAGAYGWFPDPLVGRDEEGMPDMDLTEKLEQARKRYGSSLNALIERRFQQLVYEYDKRERPMGGARGSMPAIGASPAGLPRRAQMAVLMEGGMGLRSAYEKTRQ
uniref:Uncharacterized protein n=1 Tax=viral metagenome TaxID=1070528 RepID=A0A6M3JXJ1_9ZZZZ